VESADRAALPESRDAIELGAPGPDLWRGRNFLPVRLGTIFMRKRDPSLSSLA
jgi:hypothetical protein